MLEERNRASSTMRDSIRALIRFLNLVEGEELPLTWGMLISCIRILSILDKNGLCPNVIYADSSSQAFFVIKKGRVCVDIVAEPEKFTLTVREDHETAGPYKYVIASGMEQEEIERAVRGALSFLG